MTKEIYIFGKEINEGDFMPFHIPSGKLIKSKFWATHWNEGHKEEAEKCVTELNKLNDKFIFELREYELK